MQNYSNSNLRKKSLKFNNKINIVSPSFIAKGDINRAALLSLDGDKKMTKIDVHYVNEGKRKTERNNCL